MTLDEAGLLCWSLFNSALGALHLLVWRDPDFPARLRLAGDRNLQLAYDFFFRWPDKISQRANLMWGLFLLLIGVSSLLLAIS